MNPNDFKYRTIIIVQNIGNEKNSHFKKQGVKTNEKSI